MEAKKIHKIKAALHRYANETHNKVGPEKKRDQYLATFCEFLEREKHPYQKGKIIERKEEPKKKKKKGVEEKDDKKKSKKGKEAVKEDLGKLDDAKKKAKKGKEDTIEDLKGNLDKNAKKKDKNKGKQENKENEEEEEEEGDLIPDIVITDPNFGCVIDILADQHMKKRHKKNAEQYEKHLEIPAFVINFGKKRGPILKYWKNIKKLHHT